MLPRCLDGDGWLKPRAGAAGQAQIQFRCGTRLAEYCIRHRRVENRVVEPLCVTTANMKKKKKWYSDSRIDT